MYFDLTVLGFTLFELKIESQSLINQGLSALFITNGSDEKGELYDYRKSAFEHSSKFLKFVYQIINENDQILCLSTCSYEVDDYRTVVVAREVRDGDSTTVDVNRVEVNTTPLYATYFLVRLIWRESP